ncbi:family 43 glycosylhydrolase [Pontibacter sp. E15-1]|uniref:family 43 glycosylhydrolase n=1 Tax=Pontibacter sp. E15-1 TaxID=2919918 RepID=UPI001F4F9864|nr:family 43 glycosylhydrolase [Pontibacter sp. E15-1]MCJ8165949.1 family 43 glycosylhydrolase [Pontibacter sp. E15-1]
MLNPPDKRKSPQLYLLAILFALLPLSLAAQSGATGKLAPMPLFADPVFDGAADPVVIWNKQEKKWFMFYTNRRATDATATGVTWVHGTRIGIAESVDGGATWAYRDTANITYRSDAGYTHWAPEVIEHNGLYHMYLTYVPGVFADCNHPRQIVHLTSTDLLTWDYQSTLPLVNDKVIDACVYRLPNGSWRMWYNNERDGKSIYYADSQDLYQWQDKGKAVAAHGEGPKVFRWKGKYWMVIDLWKGLGIYSSDDLLTWQAQEERLLEHPGKGKDDQAIGGHPDVVISGDRAYLFYFTHPGRSKAAPAPEESVAAKRSVIQVTELHYTDGQLTCDRDTPTYVHLKKPKPPRQARTR